MKKFNKAISRFFKLYLYDGDMIGVTSDEQNAMFLYFIIEILRIAIKNNYKITANNISTSSVNCVCYSIDLIDYTYSAKLFLYNSQGYYDMSLSIFKYGTNTERTLRARQDGIEKLCDHLVEYVNTYTNFGAYLILNDININLLKNYLLGEGNKDEH